MFTFSRRTCVRAASRPCSRSSRAKRVSFNLLPSDEEAVQVAYAENSGITVHGSATTRFLYNISNEIKNGHAVIKYWNIKDLPAGGYRIRVYAADYAGNRVVGKDEIVVRVE